ncbi:MAG: HAMP domain-containing protein, partial [Angustibacter sp.]
MLRVLGLDRSVARRIATAFGLASLMLVLVGGAGLVGAERQQNARDAVVALEGLRDQVQQLAYLDADVSGWQGYIYAQALVEGSAAAVDPKGYNLAGLLQSKDAGTKLLGQLQREQLTAQEKAAVGDAAVLWQQYFVTTDRMLDELKANSPQGRAAAYKILNGDLDEQWSALLDKTTAIQKSVDARAAAVQRDANSAAKATRNLVLAVAGISLAMAVVVGLLLVRSVVRPVKSVQGALEAMASGDLTARAQVRSVDEIGRMAGALGRAQEQVRAVVARV